MNLYRSAKKISLTSLIAAGLLVTGGLVAETATYAAGKKADAPTAAFRPTINPVIEVIAPDGYPRQYPTTSGTTLWSPSSGYAIVKGDKIKLNVFVATGGFDLKLIKVRMDNVPLVTIDKQPWNTTIDTSAMDTGYHIFEIWAQSESPAPASSNEQNIMFYLGQTAPAGSEVKASPPETLKPAAPAATAPTATPAPAATATTDTTDTSIPFGSGAPKISPATPAPAVGATTSKAGSSQETIVGGPSKETPIMPPSYPLPAVISTFKYSPSATVTLKRADGTLYSGVVTDPITLSAPMELTISVPKGATTRHFVYALYRDGSIVYQTDQQLPAGSTRIRLQARTASAQGLLPGNVTLKAWGVDQNSNYGPPTVLKIAVPDMGSAEEGVK